MILKVNSWRLGCRQMVSRDNFRRASLLSTRRQALFNKGGPCQGSRHRLRMSTARRLGSALGLGLREVFVHKILRPMRIKIGTARTPVWQAR